jgi:hypothetical protein
LRGVHSEEDKSESKSKYKSKPKGDKKKPKAERGGKNKSEGGDDGEAGGKGPGPSEANLMVEIATEICKEFFVDQYDLPYAALKIDDKMEILGIGKKRFKNFIGGIYYEQTNTVPKPESITSAINILKYKAAFKGGTRKLYERVASDTSNKTCEILYDLTNAKWECIRITPLGWGIDANPPIVFRRHGNEQPQIYPVKKYSKNIFDEFMELLNIKGKENKLLMKCYITSMFIPEIQKPILMLHGEQGAAKSTLQEIVKLLVDPRSVLSLSFPSKQEEMIQQLSHHYIAYYDNISQIKEWISNILCRAVTGSGFSKRQLYTDDDDIVYNYKRAIGFNGINLAATKADLLDRGLIILLDRLTEQQQKNISEIWSKFYEIRPKLLAYIFDILVKSLNMQMSNPVKLGKLPRMAEFAIWGETISRCMGNPDGLFTDAFKNNRRLQAIQVLETSPVAMVLNEFMEATIDDYRKGTGTLDINQHFKDLGNNRYEWKGPATDLLTQLTIKALQIQVSVKSKLWPGAPHILSRRLTEIRATLKEIGVDVEFKSDVGREKRRGIIVTKVASLAPPASPEAKNEQNDAQSQVDEGDATKMGDVTSVSKGQVASLKLTENRAQITSDNDKGDGRDGRDATWGTNVSVSPVKLRHSTYWVVEAGKWFCHNCKAKGDRSYMTKETSCKGVQK